LNTVTSLNNNSEIRIQNIEKKLSNLNSRRVTPLNSNRITELSQRTDSIIAKKKPSFKFEPEEDNFSHNSKMINRSYNNMNNTEILTN
jgi:hypothetical protein